MLRSFGNAARRALEHRYLPWYLALLAMVLSAPSLGLGWQIDDYLHRAAMDPSPVFPELSRSPARLFCFVAGGEEANRRAIAVGHLPWWAHERLRLSLFRPIAGLTHWLDYRLWPDRPALMHLQSLVWCGAAVLFCTFLFRRLLGAAWIAGLAALFFAVDGGHGLPSAWLANRNATIGACFSILTLIAYDHWRKNGSRAGAVGAPAALLLGLLSNESTLAAGAYLLAYAVFVDTGPWTARARALLPCLLVGAVWWVVYKASGFGVIGSGMYVDPAASPSAFAGAVVERAPILLFGQWAMASDLQLLLSEQGAAVFWWIAIGWLLIIAAVIAPLIRRDRTARFLAVGMLLSVLPACAVFPSDRLLFLVGIGGMGLLAQFVAGVVRGAPWVPQTSWWRMPARALCVLLLAIHLLLAPLALTQAAGNLRRLGGTVASAAASMPADPAVTDQTLLIVNTPTYFVSAFGPLIQAFHGKPHPLHTFVLGSGIRPMQIERVNERTLAIRPEGGFLARPGVDQVGAPAFDPHYGLPLFDRLFRDGTPMSPGQRIELTGMWLEIAAVTADGRPSEAVFHFDRPLEDASLRWVRWEFGAYVPFTPPAPGETVVLPAATIPL